MKPIGIGQLKKAGRKTKTMTRHTFSEEEDEKKTFKEQKIELAHLSSQKNEATDQEGQLSVDVYQTDNEIIIVAPVAGTPADQLNISVTDDVITIKGRRELPLVSTMEKEDSYIQECFWGNFSRSIVLPAAVDTNNVNAHFKNNILTIRIPKTERVRTRVIRIDEN